MSRVLAGLVALAGAAVLTGCICHCPCVEAAAKAQRSGESILEKFPPPEWGAARLEVLNRRSVVDGVFPSKEEQEFIDHYDEWKAALERRTSGR